MSYFPWNFICKKYDIFLFMVQEYCLLKVECVIMLILCNCYFPVQLLANSVQSCVINRSVCSLDGGATNEGNCSE